MTEEQRIEIFKKVLFPPFYPSDLEPVLDYDGNMVNFTNYDALHKRISGTEFTERSLIDLIAKLRVEGVLVKKQAPTLVNPKQNIPHQDKFPGVDTVEKWFRYVKTHKTSTADMTVLNELGAYLQINKIRDGSSASTDEADEVRQQREDKKNENPIKSAVKVVQNGVVRDVKTLGKDRDYSKYSLALQAAFKSLDNLTPKDVGSVQQKGGVDAWGNFSQESGWSSREQLEKFLKRVWAEVNQKIRSRATEKEVIDYIAEEIKKLSDSGIK